MEDRVLQPAAIRNGPKAGHTTRLRHALSWSVAILLLSQLAPFPNGVRLFIILGLTVCWSIAASFCSVQRFGRKAVVIIAGVLLAAAGVVGRAYWLDQPNRRLVAEIEKLPGFYTTSAPGLLAGKVDHVYINSNASDLDVARFTELSGLDGLQILFLDGPRISDETATKLGQLKSLRHLNLAGTGVSREVSELLRRQLPDCSVEIK